MFTYKYLKEGVKDSLFPNQRKNANVLFNRNRALLCDKVGAGKTLSVLAAFSVLKEKSEDLHMLVVTPKSAYEKGVWKSDIEKFTNLTCCSLDTILKCKNTEEAVDVIKANDVIYAKHTAVKDDLSATVLSYLTRLNTVVVVDEVHAFRSPTTEQTKKFREIVSDKARILWGLTGTPLSKNLEDTYHIINLISPGILGNFWQFRDRFCILKDVVIGYDKIKRQPKTAKKIIGMNDEIGFQRVLAGILIQGESFINLNYHYIDYTLNNEEMELYKKLAYGIAFEPDTIEEDWLSKILSMDTLSDSYVSRIKSVEKFSSRFLYLQSAADGTLLSNGTIAAEKSTKIDALVKLVRDIVSKKQSVLVYFDYYDSLGAVRRRLESEKLDCEILESSGRHTLKDGELTEEIVKNRPHVILCTKASAESASYYFINNTVFFQIPTVPHTFAQFNGRITRKNTLYPDDLNCYIFRSKNIDLYKLMMVSGKTKMMEGASGVERNVPEDYKSSDLNAVDKMKKVLLWCK